MGRKLIGLVVGFFLTIILAFYLFPPEYESLIRWLAPFLGPWLRFAFMFLFILFADFLSFPTVLIIWVPVGFIAGLISRSRWGAIPVAIVIFLLSIIMMIGGFVATFIPLLSDPAGLDFLAFISAIPPDVSLLDILHAPVLGPIINAILGGVEGLMGASDPMAGVLQLVQGSIMGIIINGLKNLVVLSLAAVMGGFISQAVFPPRD